MLAGCPAERIVASILEDMTGRRGLRQTWDDIDDETQHEILDAWTKIAGSNLT